MKLAASKIFSLRLSGILLLALFVVVPADMFGAPKNRNRRDKLLNRPYADMKRIHLGFSIGTHFQDLKFTHNGYTTPAGEQWFMEVPSYSPGFCVNVLADLRLHKYLNLRISPGMYFGNKDVHMRDYTTGVILSQNVKTPYLVVPLDLKFSGERYYNSRPYIVAGGMAAFDLGKKRSDYLQFNTTDFYLSIGLGCDFYLPFFKLNPEIKFCFGLSDILRHDRPDLVDNPDTYKITESLSKVKSNMIVLTFYFE